MKNSMSDWEGTPYPEIIRGLPEVDVPFEGLRGWLLQGANTQMVFFDIEPIGEVTPHAHCAQWGMLVEGEMSLTIDGETRTLKKGDWYYIPEGILHSAKFHTRVQAIDFFATPNRYKTKAA